MLDWDDVMLASACLFAAKQRPLDTWHDWELRFHNFSIASGRGVVNAAYIWGLSRTIKSANGKAISFSHMMTLCLYFDATLPLDKVFALVGMIVKHRPNDSPIVKLLKPNYNCPVSEVYTAAARTAIIEDGFNVLSARDPFVPPRDLPGGRNTTVLGATSESRSG